MSYCVIMHDMHTTGENTKMAKTKIAKRTQNEGSNPAVALSAPFTQEEFREDITSVFLHYVRNIAWMTGHETAIKILNLSPDGRLHLCDPDLEAADIGLTYEKIHHTEFAKALEQQYEYAYHGRIDRSAEALEDESIHTWIAALVCDVHESAVAAEWESYGLDIIVRARRCALVAETANARVTLEGGEPFFYSFQSNKEGYLSEDVLTVRQLALLASMEELSIRAAANPKRANPLKTITTDQGTRIEIAVAKEWLQSKGRYIPITSTWSAGELDLSKRRFNSSDELDTALDTRFKMLINEHGLEGLSAKLTAGGIKIGKGIPGPFMDLAPDDYRNEDLIRVLALTLELPEDLLVLRVKEALIKDELRHIEGAILESIRDAQ